MEIDFIKKCILQTSKKTNTTKEKVLDILIFAEEDDIILTEVRNELFYIKKEYDRRKINKIKTYKDLLLFPRDLLDKNIRGMEREKIFSSIYYQQLLEISKYMFITKSITNFSKPMFLKGLILKSYSLKLANCFRDYNINFVIREIPNSEIIDKHLIGFDNENIIPNFIENVYIPKKYKDLIIKRKTLLQKGDSIVEIMMEDPVKITIKSGKLLWQRRLYKIIVDCLKDELYEKPRIFLNRE